MRKIAILLAACLTLVGCQSNDNANQPTGAGNSSVGDTPASSGAVNEINVQKPTGGVVEIKENMFIAQINDIWLNKEDYIGKIVRYEGMFTQYTWQENNMTYYLVYRNSPGCCGADGQAGFEVAWPESADKTYPNENDWVEAAGVLEQYEEYGQTYLRLSLSSLTVKQERGAEFVSQ
ncbi:MAG: hypothetical protein LBQ48_07540 [Oscillospiraceae bacterium]|jgi:hypothetical protein|nr:hypothetical protein [Oscillospiraceae bacterium]